MTSAAPSAPIPALRRSAAIGLACGAGAVHLAVVGILLMLHQRAIIVGGLSLGQAALLLNAAGAGLMAARSARVGQGMLSGMLSGAACGLPIAALTVLIGLVPLRSIFIALSPALLDMLSFGKGSRRRRRHPDRRRRDCGSSRCRVAPQPACPSPRNHPRGTAVVVCGVFQELI
jgi:hypothetical protein